MSKLKNFIQFLKNIWYFRKPLYEFRWWDYHFTLTLLRYSIQNMVDGLERNGIEESVSKSKKIFAMRKAIELLKIIEEHEYLELAEKELGHEYVSKVKFVPAELGSTSYSLVDVASPEEKAMNRKIHDRTNEIEKEVWEELWGIIKGNQDYSKFKKNQDWGEQFNGTDMRGWWD